MCTKWKRASVHIEVHSTQIPYSIFLTTHIRSLLRRKYKCQISQFNYDKIKKQTYSEAKPVLFSPSLFDGKLSNQKRTGKTTRKTRQIIR